MNWILFVCINMNNNIYITYNNNIDTNKEGAVNCKFEWRTFWEGEIWLCWNFLNFSNVQSFSKYVLDYVLCFLQYVCVLTMYINVGVSLDSRVCVCVWVSVTPLTFKNKSFKIIRPSVPPLNCNQPFNISWLMILLKE